MSLVLSALCASAAPAPPNVPGLAGDTLLTTKLNDKIKASTGGRIFRGGNTGVMIRVPDYLSLRAGANASLSAVNVNASSGDVPSVVVPGSFLHNDVHAPSVMYPAFGGGSGNPQCPNNGWSGFSSLSECQADPGTGETGPWNFAQLGYVVADAMDQLLPHFSEIQDDNYGYGVFYASDSNSVDERCRYAQDSGGWDCPGYWINSDGSVVQASDKRGAGGYAPGNPTVQGGGGGGAGCHFASYDPYHGIDQTDAYNQGENLVSDPHCQCNYKLKQGKFPWGDWVSQWLHHAQPKPAQSWQGWFGGGKAPAFGLDFGACWLSNPTDMIGLQNALWYSRYAWSNQLSPASNWDDRNPSSMRDYWGWNEVPVPRSVMDSASNWDAIVIKLPVAICGGAHRSIPPR